MKKFFTNIGIFISYFCLSIIFSGTISYAQEKVVDQQQQLWFAYMTSTRVSERFSIWNDMHYVPGGFGVLRTGLTYQLNEKASITGGYAYLGLPRGGVTADLKRQEHRPWGQLIVQTPLSNNWNFSGRIRWDMRFRRNVYNGELIDGYGFNHRIRFLLSFRRTLPRLKFGNEIIPFVNVSDEMLINFGEDIVYNHFDQNRLTLSAGVRHKNIQIQTGYMSRYVQLTSGNHFVNNHTLILWINHQIDLRKRG